MTDKIAPLNFTTFGPEGASLGHINNNGEMVGTVYSVDEFFNYHAQGFIFANGTFTPFDVPGADNTSLIGINDQGDIVGATWSDAHPDFPAGFLYSGGAFTPIVADADGRTYVSDVNGQGQIVGGFQDSSLNFSHGFIWDGGTVTQLDNAGAYTFLHGINDAGVIVGDYNGGATGYHAFIYENGTFTTIDAHPNNGPDKFNTAADVNDWGQVVGKYIDDNYKTHGFIYQDGQFYSFDAPVVPGFLTNFTSINNLGQVGGYYVTLDGVDHSFTTTLGMSFTYDVTEFDHAGTVLAASGDPSSFGTEIRNSNIHGDFVGRYSTSADPDFTGHSFVSTGGVVSELTFAQATFGVDARDINDPGQIAGNYLDATGFHGFIYIGGTATTLDDPNADAGSMEVMGMNNAGQVVGTYMDGGVQHEFMWSSGSGFSDLDLAGSGVGSNPVIALDINDFGDIVGTYVDTTTGIRHGFLLHNGQFTTIAMPGAAGFGSGAVSINNAGQIAGFYMDGAGTVHPFVYSGGVYSTVDLAGSGGAYGIANNGTVAGSDNDGSTHHGFLAEISDATFVPVVFNTASWGHGVDGNFDDASKWQAGTVPNAGSTVLITRQTDFTVTMDTDHTIYKLRVGTANFDDAKLAVRDATLEVTGGVIDVPGTLTLDSFTGHGASLLIAKSTIISGGCGCEPDIAMGLSGNAGPISIGTAADATLGVRLLNDGAYIAGQGQIGDARMQLGNGGQIEAQGGTLTLDTGTNQIFNAGELDATPGATLDVESSVTNYGLILAAGDPTAGDATVNLNAGLNNYSILDAASYSHINIDGTVRNFGGMYSEGDLTITGNVINDFNGGFIADGGSIDITGTVTNNGTLVAADGSISIHGLVKNAGQLTSDSGLILVDGVARGGTASIIDDGAIDFGGASNTDVDFSGGLGGNLILDDVRHFTGDISGFDDSDMITLSNLLIGATTRLSFDAGSGVLRVVDHGTVAAKLNFDGSYTSSDFTLTHDSNNHVVIQHAP